MSSLLFKKLINTNQLIIKSLQIQQCRFIRPRKPPHLPRAKGKRFRVSVKPEVDQEEYKMATKLYNQYRSEMRSVYQLFKTEEKFRRNYVIGIAQEKASAFGLEAQLLRENE